jgi:hypothetical protein
LAKTKNEKLTRKLGEVIAAGKKEIAKKCCN